MNLYLTQSLLNIWTGYKLVTVRRSSNYTVHLSVQLTLQTVICASRHSPPPSLVLDYFESSLSVPCQLICVVFLRASAKHFFFFFLGILILEKSCYLHVTIPYDRITIFTQDKKKTAKKLYRNGDGFGMSLEGHLGNQ